MHKLIAGFILTIALPMLCMADAPDSPQGSPVQPSSGAESLPASEKANGDSAGTQGGAYEICLRATELFEQQEKEKKEGEAPLAPLSSSCKTELKPAKYWACMEKEAIAKVDFNSAHWRCAKKLNR